MTGRTLREASRCPLVIRSMLWKMPFPTLIRRMSAASACSRHRSQAIKLRSDSLFVDKLCGFGFYPSSQRPAIVFCIDEKSQIRAMDREQLVLPVMLGVPERRRLCAAECDLAVCHVGIRHYRLHGDVRRNDRISLCPQLLAFGNVLVK